MTNYSVPYTFIPGTKAKASEVNENFTTVLEYISDINKNSVDINFSNLTSKAKDVIYENSASGKLIGEIVTSTIPINDSSLHLLDGSLLSGTGVYKDFVEYVSKLDLTAGYFTTESSWQDNVSQYGACGKFVYDSINNTVRLPKLTGILEGVLDVNELGNLVEAGIPNIIGKYGLTLNNKPETNEIASVKTE